MGFLRRHRVLIGIGVVVALIAGGVVGAVLTVDSPGPASTDDALDRFRTGAAGDGDEPDASALRPPDGVYLYEGAGEETLSFPPLTQRDGEQMPGTVTHLPGGCWTMRVDFNAAHWQEWTHCRDGDRVVETAGRNSQEWDLGLRSVGNESTFTCEPPNVVLDPASEPGDEFEATCTGTGDTVEETTTNAGTTRVVGIEALTVGGVSVETMHLRMDHALTGGQDGTETADAWFREDGLLVRYERDIAVRTDSPLGEIRYTEVGHFALTDVDPRR